MIFDNNWAYPFAHTMYDPLLKIRLERDSGRGAGVSIGINYDPNIEKGRYTMPQTQEGRQDLLRAFHSETRALADRPIRFVSSESEKILKLGIGVQRSGEVLRFKALYPLNQEFAKHTLKALADKKIPIISENPAVFLIYVLKNWIYFPGWDGELYNWKFGDDGLSPILGMDMCLPSEVCSDIFRLVADEYEEVEPGWCCIGSRGL